MSHLLQDLINLSFWIVGWLVVVGLAASGLALIVAVFSVIVDRVRKGVFE